MGKYNFDTVIDRTGTASLKYDFAKQRAGREDLLPMWVADMDFALPDEILEEIHKRTDHGIFGYTEPDEEYNAVLKDWFLRHYHWKIDPEWNTVVPGVVYGIAAALRALTKPGDTVLIQEPVYYPFREVIEDNGRICENNQLVEINGRYEIDFEDFEKRISEKNVSVFLLCSPHNPAGRVWSENELFEAVRICRKYDVKIIADEIHCDIIYPGKTFISVGTLGKECMDNTVLCTSPSKTFNMAGLQISNILIPNPSIRRAFQRENNANGYSQCNTLGMTAAAAVYRSGDEWLSELIEYMQMNLNIFRDRINEIPGLRLIEPEGTYLTWVDCSGMFTDEKALYRFIREEAGLWLDDGIIFGRQTKLFERFNIACPKSILIQALEQLKDAAYRRAASTGQRNN